MFTFFWESVLDDVTFSFSICQLFNDALDTKQSSVYYSFLLYLCLVLFLNRSLLYMSILIHFTLNNIQHNWTSLSLCVCVCRSLASFILESSIWIVFICLRDSPQTVRDIIPLQDKSHSPDGNITHTKYTSLQNIYNMNI